MPRIRLASTAALVVVALTFSAGSSGSAGARDLRADPAQKVTRSLRQLFRSSSLNSMVFGVWVKGRPLITGALGSALPGVAATRQMHFRIGNVTEAFTDTLLLRLVDQHKVSLRDPVSKWFPRIPRARQVTLRMLATSTSGYADYVTSSSFSNAFESDPFRQFNTISLIRLGTGLPAVFAPGKSWAFSDTNFLLLGAILQRITHKSLRIALQRQILGPLGLGQTTMPSNANIPAPVMHAYSPERGKYEESTFWNPSWVALNGSMTSSLFDMGRWAAALGRGRLLSRASHRLQIGPSNAGLGPLTASRYYGFGVIVDAHWIITNPQLVGYNGTVSYFPARQLAVVVFTTLGRRSQLQVQYSTQALKLIAHILTPRSVPKLPSRPRG
jgi:D-alanyl-D-alanine carboxypeptidase